VTNLNSCNPKSGIFYLRGRFYEENSARRNERLQRIKGAMLNGVNPNYKATKVPEIGKSVYAAYLAEVSETPRYMLSNMTKENKKSPLGSIFA